MAAGRILACAATGDRAKEQIGANGPNSITPRKGTRAEGFLKSRAWQKP